MITNILLAILIVYMILNFKYDIQMFQQNSYRVERYWRWLKSNYSNAWRLIDLACCFVLVSTLIDIRAALMIVATVALIKIILIFRKKYKKPLVFTPRVRRLYTTTAIVALIIVAVVFLLTQNDNPNQGAWSPSAIRASIILLICTLSWAPMICAAWIMTPIEKMIQQRYINDAKRILRSMPNLRIVGITGSYGKTSTKHYLHRILSEQFDVLMTPGSFNTPMGVVRTIREHLKPYNEIFICEMGAKQKGDIEEICNIAHPEIGIVTAVGPMHLETFKSIENVQSTKFELIDALPPHGLAIVNNDFEYCANRPVSNVKEVKYAVTNPDGATLTATDVKYTPEGTHFTIVGADGFSLPLFTRLLGECNVSDILAAVAVALHLGVSPEKIQYAVASIQQVEHRLSMKQTPGGVTIIDDAFNSNPAGSKMAVDVLAQFGDRGKRIIVTPGMIELGNRQFELNRELGHHIGKSVDIAIIVGEYNREALTSGIKDTDFDPSNLLIVDSFNEAQQKLAAILSKGDTILYENDLPDTFK